MKIDFQNRYFSYPIIAFFAISFAFLSTHFYGEELLCMNPLRQEPLNTFFWLMTKFGEPYSWAAVILLTLFLQKPVKVLPYAVAGLACLLFAFFLKEAFLVRRPYLYLESIGLLPSLVTVPGVDINIGRSSFPSGHTISAFTLTYLLSVYLPLRFEKRGLICALIAILVGISRIFLVQHFLWDVVAGAAVGLAIGGMIYALFKRKFEKITEKEPFPS